MFKNINTLAHRSFHETNNETNEKDLIPLNFSFSENGFKTSRNIVKLVQINENNLNTTATSMLTHKLYNTTFGKNNNLLLPNLKKVKNEKDLKNSLSRAHSVFVHS